MSIPIGGGVLGFGVSSIDPRLRRNVLSSGLKFGDSGTRRDLYRVRVSEG